MPSDIAISVRDLTKTFRIFGHPGDRIKQALTLGRMRFHREFTALKDVSFDVKKGETVGIIGRNGSGKSTLLQLICGILKPTSGTITVKGHVSALLELGAGFNPEFTGRENIYFQGTLIGLRKEEIDRRFDNIVAFADIGDFIDQPVRTYSSGMFVRLALSVAIHQDPEILVIDEALSVGDEAFQRKCFSLIHEFQRLGKTILIVSHSATILLELCSRAVLLENNELLAVGKPKPLLDQYHKLLYTSSKRRIAIMEEVRMADKQGHDAASTRTVETIAGYDPELTSKSVVFYESCGAQIHSPRILDEESKQVNVLSRGKRYTYVYDVSFEEKAQQVRFSMLIKTKTGYELGSIISHPPGAGEPIIEKGTTKTIEFQFVCRLLPGLYFLNSGVLGIVGSTESFLHRVIDILAFRVQPEPSLIIGGIVDFSISGQTTE